MNEEVKKMFLELKKEIDGMDFNEMVNFFITMDDHTDEDSHRCARITYQDMDVDVDCVEGKAVVHGDGVTWMDETTGKTYTFYFQKEIQNIINH